MNLQIKCAILKRVVNLLSLFVWGSGIIGIYFVGAERIASSIVMFFIAGVCYLVACELEYIVQHWITRLELSKFQMEHLTKK